jgi:hypothetical protein
MLNYGNPKYLLILGKGLHVPLKYFRTENWTSEYRDLVPPIGYPASDVLYTSNLKNAGKEPAIPTGRVGARNAEEVYNYLTKLKEMEQAPVDDLWRKKLIHLSGGLHVNEVDLFKSYIKDFEIVAEDKFLGGDVTSVSKKTTLNVEFINISEQINKGATMVTFFGHSAPSVTDI